MAAIDSDNELNYVAVETKFEAILHTPKLNPTIEYQPSLRVVSPTKTTCRATLSN